MGLLHFSMYDAFQVREELPRREVADEEVASSTVDRRARAESHMSSSIREGVLVGARNDLEERMPPYAKQRMRGIRQRYRGLPMVGTSAPVTLH